MSVNNSVIIHLVRHAQGPHNVVEWGARFRDPFLTAEGLQQCARVQQRFSNILSGIISSPQRRTIQTALVCFPFAIGDGLQIYLLADLQEVGDAPVCVGMDIATIQNDFGPVVNVDYLDENWNQTPLALSFHPQDVMERARRARVAIREFARAVIDNGQGTYDNGSIHLAVVTHSLLIPFLTNELENITYFANAECRSYMFTDIRGTDDQATIVETQESIDRRPRPRPAPPTPAPRPAPAPAPAPEPGS
ncbi:histidine phosphatase superfamily [Daldinia caldariorum]|uniref:histidine phosphatase superfamily n=1 Tax=Daldinia caldariorum TaxID=326644 RepID=UPI002008E7BF|nr:histidine phosphatase superfamily [Daldinia caldariorum]KAI1471772.1 histidine phosphatase superfamily [Daldinia caldariorum]